MRYRRDGSRVFVRLDLGDDVHASIIEIAEKEGIGGGFLSALGAVSEAVLGYYDLERRDYDRTSFSHEMEIASAHGTLARLAGRPYVHLHAVLSDRECRAFAGHLFSAKAAATVEMQIEISTAPIERTADEETGLKLWRV
jgi:predicted DNA-binding protein with PD1-like motif